VACPTADKPTYLGPQVHERGQFPGGDLVARLRQLHGQVSADMPGRAGEDDDPVTGVDALVDVVGDEQDGDATVAAQPKDEVFQVFPGLGIDRAEWLVHEQQDGIAGERPGDGSALLHPA
jgi:hypothetical protein